MPFPFRLAPALPLAILLPLLVVACAAPRRLDRPASPRPAAAAPTPPARAATPLADPKPAQTSAAGSAAIPASPPTARTAPTVDPENTRWLNAARVELQQTYQFTGLSDAQVAQQKNASVLIDRQQGRAAHDALRPLLAQLKTGTRPYAVKRGDSLWIISAKPEVYGNPWLWPLIWQSNLQVIPDPDRLHAGDELTIRSHPKIDEVVEAVGTARGETPAPDRDTRIGEVREAPAAP